jgi:hypothetical protein
MSIVNALFGAKQAKQQAQAIERSTDRATDVQMQMFNKQQELMQPYMQAGQSGIGGLQTLVNQGQTPFSFDAGAYTRSPEYLAMQQQYEDAALRNASATGGLRSGGAQVALASIAPQLMQQGRANAVNEYSLNQAAGMDKFNQQMGLVGLGLGSAQQVGSAAGQFGQLAGNNMLRAGQARADKYANYAGIGKGLITDMGSVFNFGGF